MIANMSLVYTGINFSRCFSCISDVREYVFGSAADQREARLNDGGVVTLKNGIRVPFTKESKEPRMPVQSPEEDNGSSSIVVSECVGRRSARFSKDPPSEASCSL